MKSNMKYLKVIYSLAIMLFSFGSYELGYVVNHYIPPFEAIFCTAMNFIFIFSIMIFIFKRYEFNFNDKYEFQLIAVASLSIAAIFQGFFLSQILYAVLAFVLFFWIPFLIFLKLRSLSLVNGMKKEELFE